MGEDDRDKARSKEEHSEYLEEIPDGAGCTEIWEYLSTSQEQPRE